MANKLSRNIWPGVLLVIAFVVVAVGAWGIGRPGRTRQARYLRGQAATVVATTSGLPTPTKSSNPRAKCVSSTWWRRKPIGRSPQALPSKRSLTTARCSPAIRITEGDTLRVTLKNELDKATTIHWHGLHVPNSMDGVPPFTQQGIEPGQSFTHEFLWPRTRVLSCTTPTSTRSSR